MKPNPDCDRCGGTGYFDPLVGKEPCNCWTGPRAPIAHTDLSSGHDEQHDDKGHLDLVEKLYGDDHDNKL
jgi:hypothetical protein